MTIVRVALDLPLQTLFDYVSTDALANDLGRRAVVPFGHREKVGVIVEVLSSSNQPTEKLRAVTGILRDMAPLPSEWISLCKFCARYYQRPLGEVLSLALPPLLRKGGLRAPRAWGTPISPRLVTRPA